jgi:hypothetical protein
MSVLDLQTMTTGQVEKGPPAGSRASKGCEVNGGGGGGGGGGGDNVSTLSLLLCAR